MGGLRWAGMRPRGAGVVAFGVTVAAERHVGVDALLRDVGEVGVGPVAGIGEQAPGAVSGVGLDLVDEGGQDGSCRMALVTSTDSWPVPDHGLDVGAVG